MREFIKTKAFKESLSFIILTYVISGFISCFMLLNGIEEGMLYKICVVLATASPSISAVLLLIAKEGFNGAFYSVKKMLDVKIGMKIYLIIILLPFAFMFMGKLFSWIIFGLTPLAWIMVPDTIATSFVSPLGEEFGWRGFLTGHLSKHFSILKTAVIVGLIWAGWHYWFYLIPGEFSIEVPVLFFILSCIADSLWITYFYVKNKESVLMGILFHFAYNLSYRIIPIRPSFYFGNGLTYLITVIIELILAVFVILNKWFVPIHCKKLQ